MQKNVMNSINILHMNTRIRVTRCRARATADEDNKEELLRQPRYHNIGDEDTAFESYMTQECVKSTHYFACTVHLI